MTREEAHHLVDYMFDNEHTVSGLEAGQLKIHVVEDNKSDMWPEDSMPTPFEEIDAEVSAVSEPETEAEVPVDKRVVRTKSSGDRVYMLDEVRKTRQWVTNPDVLKGLGFTPEDVKEIANHCCTTRVVVIFPRPRIVLLI